MKNKSGLMKAGAILDLVSVSLMFLLIILIVLLDNSSDYTEMYIILAFLTLRISGSIFLIYASNDVSRIMKHKALVIICIIISFSTLLAGILNLIGYIEALKVKDNPVNAPPVDAKNVVDVKKEEPKKVEVISKENRKIDILTKLGSLLIVFSGIVFATSEELFNYGGIIKPLFIACLTVLFRLLSVFFEKKIKIQSTSKLYYVISYILFTCTVIALFYFETFGYYFSYSSSISDMIYALTCLSISYSIIKIQNKYDINGLKQVSFAFVILSNVLVLIGLDLNVYVSLIILIGLSFVLYLFKDRLEEAIIDVNDITFGIYLIYYLLKYSSNDVYLTTLGFITGLLLFAYLRFRINTKDRFAWLCRYMFPVYTCLFTVITIILAKNECSVDSLFVTANVFNYRLIIVALMMIYNFFFIRGKDKETVISGIFATHIISVITTLTLLTEEYSLVAVCSSVLIFISSTKILKVAMRKSYKVFAFIIQLISMLLLSVAFVNFYKLSGVEVSSDVWLLLCLSFIAIAFIFERKEFDDLNVTNVIYNTIIIGLSLFSSIFITSHTLSFNLVMILVIVGFRFLSKYEEKDKHVYNFILIMTIYLHLFGMFVNYTSILISSLILLIALLIASYYINKDKYTPYLTLIFAYIPYVTAISELELNGILPYILSRLPLMVLIFVITRKVLSLRKKEKFTIEIIGLGLVFLSLIIKDDTNLALFTGLISLIMIFLGFKIEKYNSLFYVGLGATILNILFEIVRFWDNLSLFAYLLISGLIIIGYVTYIALKKDKKEEKVKTLVIQENVDGRRNVINVLLLVGIVICLGINFININKFDEVKNEKAFETALMEKGIDPDKVKIFDNNNIAVLKGYHLNIRDYISIYENYYDVNDYDYENDYLVQYYVYYTDDLSKKDYNYDYDYFISMNDTTDQKYKYQLEDVTFEVRADYINYINENYGYKTTDNNIKLNYIYDDVSNMSICFDNPSNKTIEINYDGEVSEDSIILTDSGCVPIDSDKGQTYSNDRYLYINVYPNMIDIIEESENQIFDNN